MAQTPDTRLLAKQQRTLDLFGVEISFILVPTQITFSLRDKRIAFLHGSAQIRRMHTETITTPIHIWLACLLIVMPIPPAWVKVGVAVLMILLVALFEV